MKTEQIKIEIKSEILLITPSLAAEFLSRNVKNRKLNNSVVQEYKRQILDGQWQLTPQGISFNEYNELMDGQHRLTAILEANKGVNMFVFYNVPDNSFKVLDTGFKRNTNQIFAMNGIKYAMEKAAGIRRFILMENTSTNALANIKNNTNVSSTSIYEYYQNNKILIDDLTSIAIAYYNKTPFFSKANILAIILHLHITRKHSIITIQGFFDQLFHGRTINNNGIELLRSKLIQSALMPSLKIKETVKLVLLKKVWNAYIKGVKIKKLMLEENKPSNIINFE